MGAAKAVLIGKFIAKILPQETRKTNRIDNLTLHLKQLEKEEQQKKPKISEGKKS